MRSPDRLRDSTSSTPSQRHRKARRPSPPPHRRPPSSHPETNPTKGMGALENSLPRRPRSHSFVFRGSSGGGCLHKAGENRRGPGAQRGSRPGAAGRSPWGEGKGRDRRGGRRPRGASGWRPSASRLAPHPAGRGPRPGPGRRSCGCAESRAVRTPSASLTPHRREGLDREAGRGASRQSLPRCPPPQPPSPLSPSPPPWSWGALRFRWAITLFHTRPTHSGNGSERPLSAQAPRRRAGSQALSLLQPGPSDASLRRRQTQTMKGGFAEGLTPHARAAAHCAGVPSRPAGTMKSRLAGVGPQPTRTTIPSGQRANSTRRAGLWAS